MAVQISITTPAAGAATRIFNKDVTGLIAAYGFDSLSALRDYPTPGEPAHFFWDNSLTSPPNICESAGLGTRYGSSAARGTNEYNLAAREYGSTAANSYADAIAGFPTIETSTVCPFGGGVGSLKLVIPKKLGERAGGFIHVSLPFLGLGTDAYTGPYSPLGPRVFIQWREYFDSHMLDQNWENGGILGWKTFIMGLRPQPGGDIVGSGNESVVAHNANLRGVVAGYGHLDTAGMIAYGGTYHIFGDPQDAMGCPYHASGGTSPPSDPIAQGLYYYPEGLCHRFHPNVWHEFTYMIHATTPGDDDPTTIVELYADGLLVNRVTDYRVPWSTIGGGYGQFMFLHQQTNRDAHYEVAYDTYSLVDDVIIATDPIPMMGLFERTAITMDAGTWAAVATTGMMAAFGGTGGTDDIINTYSMELVRDPVDRCSYFLGSDHGGNPTPGATATYRFVRYSELTNAWTVLPTPPWAHVLEVPDVYTDAHGYQLTAINVTGRKLYRLPYGRNIVRVYDLDLETWSELPAVDAENLIVGTIVFFPERNELLYSRGGGGTGIIWSYSLATTTWSDISPAGLAAGSVSATWQWSIYNAFKHEVLFGSSSNHLWKYSSAGVFTRLTDIPDLYRTYNGTGQAGMWTADPSGKYIIITDPSEDPANPGPPGTGTVGTGRNTYTYDSTTQTYASAVTMPNRNFSGVIDGVPINELGVTMWITTINSAANVYLYKYA